MSQDPDNNLAEKGLRIVGVYQAEFPSQEELYAFMGKRQLQQLLEMGGTISELAIFTHRETQLEQLQEQLRTAASDDSDPLTVRVWSEINGYLGGTLKLMDGFVLVWIIVVFLALSFGLANTLVMAVFERVREIGLMMALGMRPRLILLQILVESVYLLLIGLLIGNLLAWFSVQAVADGIDISAVADGLEMAGMGTVLYPLLLRIDIVTANAVVILLGLLTSFLPAWRAARYDPIRALTKPT